MLYDLIVAGGGAAGMMAAITAAENGKHVLIIEKMNRLGKKILATGNGRCNFTNSYLDQQCFRGTNPDFAYIALEQFGWEETADFFRRLGIEVVDKDGYYYPASNQAATIADGLYYKLKSLDIDVVTDAVVEKAEKKKKCFTVYTKGKTYQAKNLLLAAGGMAQPKLGSDGSGYGLAKSFGHKLVEPFPALTALKIKGFSWKEAAGVRSQAEIKVWQDGRMIAKESGELQITKYGVSGVMIFQLSRYVIFGMKKKKQISLTIDLLPSKHQNRSFFEQMTEYSYYKTASQWLEGYLSSKLVKAVLQMADVNGEKNVLQLNKKEKARIWNCLKEAEFQVSGWNEFDFAQVTAGGISTRQVSPYTMESELVEGLYLAGELLDIDGTCGGYNLQWAWTSGYLAGRSIQ